MQQGNKVQVGDVMQRAQGLLAQAGIEIPLAIKTLVIALVSGLLAAIVDTLFELPTSALVFTFVGFIAVLNGASYAFYKGKENLAGVIMAGVNGFVTLLIWWIITKIIGERGNDFFKYNPADAYNVGKVFLDGILMGLIGIGWFALLRRLPSSLPGMKR
jgi:hypothetical protein